MEKLSFIVSECNIHNMQQIEKQTHSFFSAEEELKILNDFLINFRA